MGHLRSTIPLLSLLAALTSPALATNPAEPAATAINTLGLDLLRSGDQATSTLLSPYSIQTALAMAYAGAEGETRTQMAKVLHYPERDIHRSFSALEKQFNESLQATIKIAKDSHAGIGGPSEPITLTIANRLYGQSGSEFRPAFLDLLERNYGASLQPIDFRHDPAAATRSINDWVAQQTRQHIRDLIPSPLDPETRLVLVNALFLKAPWQNEFYEGATRPAPFHLISGESIIVPTMQERMPIAYLKESDFCAVALPYSGGDFQFLILLPDSRDGLPALEQKLSAELLQRFTAMKFEEVALDLPKFKLAPPSIALVPALQKLGLTRAFDIPPGSANFDSIAPRTPSGPLFLSNIYHKTYLALDEKGTEAAAAIAVPSLGGRMPGPIEVKVDRPFLFAIQHRPTGACLFLGRLMNPSR